MNTLPDKTPIMLSENFSYWEMTHSVKGEAAGLDNTPTTEQMLHLLFLCRYGLQPIRDAWGGPISVSSGFRTPKVNKLVGGSASSAHMSGYAADITAGSKSKNRELFELIKTRFVYDQLIDENDLLWIHYSLKPSGNRMEVKKLYKK